MRVYIFTSGAAILALGVASLFLLDKPDAVGFLRGALTLGGGIVICGLFSIGMRTHGFVAAGVMGLLGAARGLGNVPGLVRFIGGERDRGSAPLLEMGVALISFLLLARVVRFLYRERLRRMLEEE